MIKLLLDIFLILLQIAGGLSLVILVTIFVMAKRGFEFNFKFLDDEPEEQL